MENKMWIGISITLLITLLGSISYTITNQTYYCSERGIVMECARFSSSGFRCYPNLLNTKGYKDCSEWTKIEIPKIDKQTVPETANTKKYLCDQKECVPI